MRIPSTYAERHFLPFEDTFDAHRLSERLLAAGHGRAKVAGCVQFMLAVQHDGRLPSGASQAEYRKMLHDLVENDGPGGAKMVSASNGATPG